MNSDILKSCYQKIPAQYLEGVDPLFIVGPTSSGKTALAIYIARLHGPCAIISADSRQIYIGLDIVTGKEKSRAKTDNLNPRFEPYKIEGIDHYLLDILKPNQTYTMFDFKDDCQNLIRDLSQKGIKPIIAGGTGLYIDAVINNYQLNLPDKSFDPEIKKQIEDNFNNDTNNFSKEEALELQYKQLLELDPHSARKIHKNNLHGVQRALEFALTTKKSKDLQKAIDRPNFDYKMIYLKPDRAWLYQKIDARVIKMFEQGLVDETKKLINDFSLNLPSLSSIGYSQVISYLNSEISYEKAIDLMQQATRQYAKRQYTWFNRYKANINCLTIEYPN